MNEAVEIEVLEVELYERDTTLRMPFKFGVVILTESPQCFARVRVRLPDGSGHWGVSAEILAPKWFDKNLELSNEDNFEQLRRALRSAAGLYTGAGRHTPFGLYSTTYDEQIRRCGEHGDGALVACYGPALLDRAVLDAVCRGLGISFFQAVQRNVPGLTTDEFDVAPFLAGLSPAAAVHARHTVGMVDPISHNPEPVGDGLPETLAQVIETYGHRYFKIKVGGDMAADVARLQEIAAVLDTISDEYYLSLDGNEQYTDVAGVAALLDAIEAEPALKRFNASTLFVEQPIARSVALDVDVSALSARIPVIIDESDATLDAFPRARALGYRGVSSKSCKGLYKSMINAARCANWGEGYFMSGEDLTTQAGVCVQQDLALASMIGLTHIERNGHHYVNGFNGASVAEQEAFLAAHPDMYHRADGVVRLTIEGGRIAIGSLDRPGFAVGAEPDFGAMKELANG
jgi:L-alanine-DL-glutamate epimerase-like enolase superfamily enzyme